MSSTAVFKNCTGYVFKLSRQKASQSSFSYSPWWWGAAPYSCATAATCSVQKTPDRRPTSGSTDTCRRLSPTSGSLPTAHCWQSTMHCPDSANGERVSVYMSVSHVQGPGENTRLLSSQVSLRLCPTITTESPPPFSNLRKLSRKSQNLTSS